MLQVPSASGIQEQSDNEPDDGERAPANEPCDLTALKQRINDAIHKLGGKVTPKLNWSAPTDAAWISPSGLKCCNADEVLLLLKSSDRIAHDVSTLEEMNRETIISDTPDVAPAILLKKHIALRNDREFRCFVCEDALVGICQRDPTQYHAAIVDERASIQALIQEFWDGLIRPQFSLQTCAPFHSCPIPNCSSA